MQQKSYETFFKDPRIVSAAINLILFAGMMILFRPGMENAADRGTGSGFFSVFLVLLSAAALWAIGYVSFESAGAITGRLMALGCLFYLSFECYVRINSVKTLIVLLCTAVFCFVRGRKKVLPLVMLLLFAVLLGYLIHAFCSGMYSISSTMPAVDPFVFGQLRYHDPLSAVRDYLKYEPRNVVRIPMLYLELFLAYFVWMYAKDPGSGSGKKARIAAALSMVFWIAIIFAGRLFSFLGYYWVYSCAFIPPVFILMYFIQDVKIPDTRRIYVHIILLLMIPTVVISARFADAWRFAASDDVSSTVYLYEVNPYELTGD